MRGLFLCGHHFGFTESGKLRIASSRVRSSECQGIAVSVVYSIIFMNNTLRRPVEHLWLVKMRQTQRSCSGASTACLYCYLMLAVGLFLMASCEKTWFPTVFGCDSGPVGGSSIKFGTEEVLQHKPRIEFYFYKLLFMELNLCDPPWLQEAHIGVRGGLHILQWQVDILTILMREHFLWGASLNLVNDLFWHLSPPLCFSSTVSFMGQVDCFALEGRGLSHYCTFQCPSSPWEPRLWQFKYKYEKWGWWSKWGLSQAFLVSVSKGFVHLLFQNLLGNLTQNQNTLQKILAKEIMHSLAYKTKWKWRGKGRSPSLTLTPDSTPVAGFCYWCFDLEKLCALVIEKSRRDHFRSSQATWLTVSE